MVEAHELPLLQRKTASTLSISECDQLLFDPCCLMAEIAGGLLPKLEFALLSEVASRAHGKCI
jgi:hypothetical protein